ncbi:hypothetical protein BTR14_03115 [Rhizobium rhizosphaerae]|uniref:Winged helix-turn-helix domain-containing protein n=2 Tax=Xaviernesmea rhizosphaerae TaxID=1672749 RepID=A0ABX3PHD0_9HYPH|nr:hypothetical protein BTR14_03115 [Xaviernesmea rhizosphaerae]
MSGGATEGERSAARARAEAMAASAGLTLAQAVSSLSGQANPEPVNFFAGFADWMEQKQPGYKAARAKEEAERNTRAAIRRAEILRAFGTLRAFMDPTPLEALLFKAGKPFVTKWVTFEDVCGTRRRHADVMKGTKGRHGLIEDFDPQAVQAVKEAIPFPLGVSAAFEELKQWDRLEKDRALFTGGEYYFDARADLRIELLRDVMRNQPVAGWADLEARFHYKSYDWQQQWIDERAFEDAEWSRVFADFAILRARCDPPADAAQNGHAQFERRTNADKAAQVREMAATFPDLSSREIGRRLGVSPQTVSTWRRKMAEGRRV